MNIVNNKVNVVLLYSRWHSPWWHLVYIAEIMNIIRFHRIMARTIVKYTYLVFCIFIILQIGLHGWLYKLFYI